MRFWRRKISSCQTKGKGLSPLLRPIVIWEINSNLLLFKILRENICQSAKWVRVKWVLEISPQDHFWTCHYLQGFKITKLSFLDQRREEIASKKLSLHMAPWTFLVLIRTQICELQSHKMISETFTMLETCLWKWRSLTFKFWAINLSWMMTLKSQLVSHLATLKESLKIQWISLKKAKPQINQRRKRKEKSPKRITSRHQARILWLRTPILWISQPQWFLRTPKICLLKRRNKRIVLFRSTTMTCRR